MFVSTTVRSDMLMPRYAGYKFSIPYNFVRGRNIYIGISGLIGEYQAAANTATIVTNGTMLNAANMWNFNIPDTATTYVQTVTFESIFIKFDQWGGYTHTIEITCDLASNIITFRPTGLTLKNGVTAGEYTSGGVGMPFLIVVNTILP